VSLQCAGNTPVIMSATSIVQDYCSNSLWTSKFPIDNDPAATAPTAAPEVTVPAGFVFQGVTSGGGPGTTSQLDISTLTALPPGITGIGGTTVVEGGTTYVIGGNEGSTAGNTRNTQATVTKTVAVGGKASYVGPKGWVVFAAGISGTLIRHLVF
jgi:hypothetical protein